MEFFSYDRDKKTFTTEIKNKALIFDCVEDLYYLKDTINIDKIKWKFDENNLFYLKDKNGKKKYLIEKIFNT